MEDRLIKHAFAIRAGHWLAMGREDYLAFAYEEIYHKVGDDRRVSDILRKGGERTAVKQMIIYHAALKASGSVDIVEFIDEGFRGLYTEQRMAGDLGGASLSLYRLGQAWGLPNITTAAELVAIVQEVLSMRIGKSNPALLNEIYDTLRLAAVGELASKGNKGDGGDLPGE
jgi:hypothetical protein